MADIRRLDGSIVDASKLARDERIAEMLAELVEINDEGKMTAIITVYLTHGAAHGVNWILPLEDFGYPWGLALRGALLLAQGRLDDGVMPAPEPPAGA